MDSYIHRTIEDKFLRMSNFFKALLITGARQVGKTTTLKYLAEGQNRTIVSLDNDEERELAQTDPVMFFQRYKPPILIDEIQKAPRLFNRIKVLCDNSELKGQFWMTGSQKFSMMKNVNESLAGRIGIMELHSLSRSELCGYRFVEPLTFDMEFLLKREQQTSPTEINEVFAHIWRGGMPAVQAASCDERKMYFESYINSYLMRDVMEIGRVEDTVKFRKFLAACAALTAQQLNLAHIASIVEIAQATASNWLKLLESLNIIYLLQPYSSNLLKRLCKTPKLYFWDTGLCAYLTKWSSPEVLMSGAASGAFFETFVVTELLRSYEYSSIVPNISYFRDSNTKEIDLFVQTEQSIHPLEIKLSAMPNKREVKKFEIIDKVGLLRGSGGIICMCETTLPINNIDCLIPVRLI
ncbi:MAG: ATP-binding protein [Christensenellaceae bacterium]|jgi:predicted AAA+ superfamily ATPase|nr:ATP-binding protein [Christensenellaceae bacterium]